MTANPSYKGLLNRPDRRVSIAPLRRGIHLSNVDNWRVRRARSLRRDMTEAEIKLWYTLRGRRFCGYKFVRQAPIGPYFADFCCRARRLIVEADGVQHADNRRDGRRDAFLRTRGYRVLRFSKSRDSRRRRDGGRHDPRGAHRSANSFSPLAGRRWMARSADG